MTIVSPRTGGYVVVLDEPISGAEAERILNAIRMIKGVVAVSPVKHDPALEIERARSDIAWQTALRNLKPPKPF